MAMQTAQDIPMLIVSQNSSSERRISPSWSISHFKTRLEPITGISSGAQKLELRLGGSQRQPIAIEAADEDSTQLANWPLRAYAEIHVTNTNPHSTLLPPTSNASTLFSPESLATVPKYEIPLDTYEHRADTVLDYKRQHGIGRFASNADEIAAEKAAEFNKEIEGRGISVGKRCQLLPASSDGRRGVVAFVGIVAALPGVEGAKWVGVRLDEPVGKNDGTVGGKRYFDAPKNCGVFLRGERVECGEFPENDELDGLADEDMEEI